MVNKWNKSISYRRSNQLSQRRFFAGQAKHVYKKVGLIILLCKIIIWVQLKEKYMKMTQKPTSPITKPKCFRCFLPGIRGIIIYVKQLQRICIDSK